mmetsp:Transcript_13738/g.19251  ORF Transcript_13738/g.19251 Transcript_13738/m.19251 type:complete len:362 (-) Transcript_13738:97-1182(-)
MEPSEQKQTYSAECLLDLNFLNKKKSEEQKRKVSAFADEILKKFKEIWNSEAFQKRREILRLAIERAEAARRNFLLQNLYIHGPMSSVIPFIQIGSGWRGIRIWDKEDEEKSKAPYTWLITGQSETEYKVQHSTGFISDEVVVKLALVDRSVFDELTQSSSGTNPDAYTSQLSLSIDSPYCSAEDDNGYTIESSQDREKSDDKTNHKNFGSPSTINCSQTVLMFEYEDRTTRYIGCFSNKTKKIEGTWSKWNESGVFYLEVVPDNELRLFQSVEKEKVFEIQSISKLIRGVGLLHYLEEIRQLSLKAKQLMAASMSTWLDICKKIELPEQEKIGSLRDKFEDAASKRILKIQRRNNALKKN